jgi:hypothetical protein
MSVTRHGNESTASHRSPKALPAKGKGLMGGLVYKTTIRSRSRAYAPPLPNVMLFIPACSGTETLTVVGVDQLPLCTGTAIAAALPAYLRGEQVFESLTHDPITHDPMEMACRRASAFAPAG